MKLLLTFVSILIAYHLSEAYLYPVPLQRLQAPLFVVESQQQSDLQSQQNQNRIQQYFTQDALGQYAYGYIEPLSTKQEVRNVNGVTTGSYSYIDAHGLLQTVDYTADDEGFRVAATNLPKINQYAAQPVQETAEVAVAREQHLAAHQAILAGNRSASSILPRPVEDTIEVAEAKKEFFARFSAELDKQNLLRKTALLRNQQRIEASSLQSAKSVPSNFKSQTTPANFVGPKSSLIPEVGAFAYGYKIRGAINPARYYLPIV